MHPQLMSQMCVVQQKREADERLWNDLEHLGGGGTADKMVFFILMIFSIHIFPWQALVLSCIGSAVYGHHYGCTCCQP